MKFIEKGVTVQEASRFAGFVSMNHLLPQVIFQVKVDSAGFESETM